MRQSCAALRAVVAILGVVGASTPASPQTLPGEIERDVVTTRLRQYQELIAEYRRDPKAAVDRALASDFRQLRQLPGAIETERDAARPWPPARFKAAAMLHTDAALRLIDDADENGVVLHLELAAAVLKKAGTRTNPFTGRWVQAVARLLRARNMLTAAERFLDAGRRSFPTDPAVLFESGTLAEMLAADTILPNIVMLRDLRAPATGSSDGSPRPVTRDEIEDLSQRRHARLARAAAWLRASLDADRFNARTQLHLGRVQTLRGNDSEGLRLLQQASGSADPAIAYLAWLFTGAAYEKHDRLTEAVQAYRTAVDRMPLGQAAQMALSAALERSGRASESREVLSGTLDATPASRREPWWSYFSEASAIAIGRVDQLRREARE